MRSGLAVRLFVRIPSARHRGCGGGGLGRFRLLRRLRDQPQRASCGREALLRLLVELPREPRFAATLSLTSRWSKADRSQRWLGAHRTQLRAAEVLQQLRCQCTLSLSLGVGPEFVEYFTAVSRDIEQLKLVPTALCHCRFRYFHLSNERISWFWDFCKTMRRPKNYAY